MFIKFTPLWTAKRIELKPTNKHIDVELAHNLPYISSLLITQWEYLVTNK